LRLLHNNGVNTSIAFLERFLPIFSKSSNLPPMSPQPALSGFFVLCGLLLFGWGLVLQAQLPFAVSAPPFAAPAGLLLLTGIFLWSKNRMRK
jgi:hypothetical protein